MPDVIRSTRFAVKPSNPFSVIKKSEGVLAICSKSVRVSLKLPIPTAKICISKALKRHHFTEKKNQFQDKVTRPKVEQHQLIS